MGLFKKRSTDPEEMERLKAEIAAMGERLSASDHAKDELRQTVHGLKTRIETPIAPPPTEPPPAPAPSVDPAQIDMMNAKIERLSAQVEASPLANAPMIDVGRVDDLAATLDQLSARLGEVEQSPTSDTEATIDQAQLDDLQTTLQRITDRIEELDGRITSISTELANQINEISGDLDGLGANEPATDEVVDELRDAQTRLATEQARYQIAFRQDLADLATRLRKA